MSSADSTTIYKINGGCHGLDNIVITMHDGESYEQTHPTMNIVLEKFAAHTDDYNRNDVIVCYQNSGGMWLSRNEKRHFCIKLIHKMFFYLTTVALDDIS